MNRCPKCQSAKPYVLSDGRFKCRVCSHRFSWTSIWDSIRLPARTKHRLLDMFVLGVPVNRQRFGSSASAPTMERFYRLARFCCAMAEELREPFDEALEWEEGPADEACQGKRGWTSGKVVVSGIVTRNGLVNAMPADEHSRVRVMEQIQAHAREGALCHTDQWQPYATLRVHGEHVMVRSSKGGPAGKHHITGIEGFWSYAKNWLQPYRAVPHKYFHLYLGEVCFRFNHRDEDLKPLLLKLMRSISIQEVPEI